MASRKREDLARMQAQFQPQNLEEERHQLSAGIKATVFSAGYSTESGNISESGSSPSKSKLKGRYRASTDFSTPKPAAYDGQRKQQYNQGEDFSSTNRTSKEWTMTPSSPPPTTLHRDKYLSPGIDSVSRAGRDTHGQNSHATIRNRSPHSDVETECNDVIYTSETVVSSNNPKYSPLEEHRFPDQSKRRSSNVVIRIWAGSCGSNYFVLLEWRLDLCCLRFIGKELQDLPTSLPNNTILFRFPNGFYTAPDEEDTMEHPHTPLLEPTSTIMGFGVAPSYTYESVMRLNNLHECIADTKKSRDEIKHNIELALNKENAPLIMQKRRGECTERLWHLQRQVGHELNVLEEAQGRAAALRKEHTERRKAMTESRERGQTQEMYLEQNMANLAKNKESLFHTLKEFSTKRTELIATLFTIFPITESEIDPNLLKICSVPLPNSVYTGLDEDSIAIALGFTCHLVTMLAHYLSVPLRYPLTPMGSRALVLDPVSLLIGPKEFPLYGKGQERNRFEYGVFLLNKNIEQLMNSQGLQFMDLRQTLPNLRYLMETLLTSSPTQSTLYRSKVISRSKQDRQEQERLNDLFIISLEQREFERILHPDPNVNPSDSSGKDQGVAGTDKRRHERTSSTSKTNNGSERSSLLREYDPIEGDYMLILDNASTKSQRSRRETSNSDASASEQASGHATPVPLSTTWSGHHRTLSNLRHGYVSSVCSSMGETEDEDKYSKGVDDPTFRDWAGEVADAMNGLESEHVDLSKEPEPDTKIDPNNEVSARIQNQHRVSDEQPLREPINATSSTNPLTRVSSDISNSSFKKLSTGGTMTSQSIGVETDVDDAIGPRSTPHSSPLATTATISSKDYSRAHSIERIGLLLDERTEDDPLPQQKEQEHHMSEDGLLIHGPTSTTSPASPVGNSISSWNQRGRRLSDKHMTNNGDGDLADSKDMTRQRRQSSPVASAAVAPSLGASG
ncbi:hypothetical protein BGX26_003883 [Mortierella sp. AD094]|nr:hypothetical protein BGX26_003883 [Mortierella sp. AD094]